MRPVHCTEYSGVQYCGHQYCGAQYCGAQYTVLSTVEASMVDGQYPAIPSGHRANGRRPRTLRCPGKEGIRGARGDP
jgi:hypothetical protein